MKNQADQFDLDENKNNASLFYDSFNCKDSD